MSVSLNEQSNDPDLSDKNLSNKGCDKSSESVLTLYFEKHPYLNGNFLPYSQPA